MITRTVACFVLAGLLLAAGTSQAQLFRAYLASDGSDANPCTLAQPCRLLPAAISAVMSGGEIWMLDSANYNTSTVAIGKSVSILAVPGAIGSIVAAAGGPAIAISSPGLRIALRNLVIVPLASNPGTHGIYMTAASQLSIEGCLLANLPSYGIWLLNAGNTASLNVTGTIFRSIGSNSLTVENGGTAQISGVQMLDNGLGGVFVASSNGTTSTATISDLVVSGGLEGILSYAIGSGSVTRVEKTRSTIRGTSYALDVGATNSGVATLAISNNMVVGNTHGWLISGGAILSVGNNHFTGNTRTSGVLTAAPPQ